MISSAQSSPSSVPGSYGIMAECNVRGLMGEDGFTIGELSDPKTLRFSLGEPDPADLEFRLELSIASSARKISTSVVTSAIICDDEVVEPLPLGKYAGFIQVSSTSTSDDISPRSVQERYFSP